jgi:hypothetical protein
VIYFGKLKDGTVFERKGSDEEPFEFTTMEGALCYSSALLSGMSIHFCIFFNHVTCPTSLQDR